ncbi:unnamed protein product [Cutaneotrichosporon oleaginosum]
MRVRRAKLTTDQATTATQAAYKIPFALNRYTSLANDTHVPTVHISPLPLPPSRPPRQRTPHQLLRLMFADRTVRARVRNAVDIEPMALLLALALPPHIEPQHADARDATAPHLWLRAVGARVRRPVDVEPVRLVRDLVREGGGLRRAVRLCRGLRRLVPRLRRRLLPVSLRLRRYAVHHLAKHAGLPCVFGDWVARSVHLGRVRRGGVVEPVGHLV